MIQRSGYLKLAMLLMGFHGLPQENLKKTPFKDLPFKSSALKFGAVERTAERRAYWARS